MADRHARTVLMLQGPPCRFWRELGDGFRAAGVRVIHVGVCLADVALWRRPDLRLYRGGLAAWPGWLERLIRLEGVDDILYYADRQPYHAAAIEVARRLGRRAWAIENGYLRPDWITMEPEAMGAFSRFPRSPREIRRLAGAAPPPDLRPRHRHSFAREASSEVVFHLLMTAGRPLFPRYVTGKHYPPVLDYLSWLRKWAAGSGALPAETALRARGPFFLLAMQLQSDYQIRASSPYRCLSEMIRETLASFARHAPRESRLVVKLHPMDNGWERWPRRIRAAAAAEGVAARVQVIEGGALDELLARARGLVTVNSTTGLQAMRLGCPVIALGDAVYDVPGLTSGQGLDRFWRAPEPADPELLATYLAALSGWIQVRGSFYDPAGRRAAISEIVRRLGEADAYWRLHRPLTELGTCRRARRAAGDAPDAAVAAAPGRV